MPNAKDQREGPYYAQAGMVWKRPVKTKNADGSTTISIGFPVCQMHDCVGPEAAAGVAHLMNVGAKSDR